MKRLGVTLLVAVFLGGCDEEQTDDRAADGGPFPPLNMIQLKGYERSDWRQTDPTAERAPAFEGHDRPLLGQQVVDGARVFHLPYYPHRGDSADVGGEFGWDVFHHRAPGDDGPCPARRSIKDTYQSSCFDELLQNCAQEVRIGKPDPLHPRPPVGGAIALPTRRPAPIFILISHQPMRFPAENLDCFSSHVQWEWSMVPEVKIAALEAFAFENFPLEEIVTPAEIRGRHPTLRDAMTIDGWPTMDHFFGRYFFIFLDNGIYRDAYRTPELMEPFGLRDTWPLFFTLADGPDDPEAAFFSLPAAQLDEIRARVQDGFIVHAHSLDAAELEAARQAGAHLLTGLELADIAIEGAAGCNPVTSERWVGCQPTDFERPPTPAP